MMWGVGRERVDTSEISRNQSLFCRADPSWTRNATCLIDTRRQVLTAKVSFYFLESYTFLLTSFSLNPNLLSFKHIRCFKIPYFDMAFKQTAKRKTKKTKEVNKTYKIGNIIMKIRRNRKT